MAEEEHYEVVDISDIIIHDTDQYFEADHLNAEVTESENTIQQSDNITPEENTESIPQAQVKEKVEVIRSTRLPMARIKNMMKMDPDVSVVSGEAVFLVTKATVSNSRTISVTSLLFTIICHFIQPFIYCLGSRNYS